jgi:xylan 1,4-beta-xylosidase
VQIGFMPQALSRKPEPYQHHWSPQGGNISTGWAYPPSDYREWGKLVYQWVTHCVGRYGRSEVERWYWEVWNEPNIMYWRGTAEDYHRLYDHAADAVKRALPAARVGGPEIAGTRTPEAARFLRDFIEHCLRGTNHVTGKVGAPLDFLAFHAKGSPRIALGHVQMGIATQLQDIDRGFEVVAGFPELKGRPIVIGESDPRDHSNAFEAWKRMGSPFRPTSQQLAALKRSAQLEAITSPCWQRPQAGALSLKFPLPRQAVSLVTLRGDSRGEGL